MPKKGYKSITVRKKTFEELKMDSKSVDCNLQKILEEKEHLRNFASKIKKYPETVRVYTNPFMVKK